MIFFINRILYPKYNFNRFLNFRKFTTIQIKENRTLKKQGYSYLNRHLVHNIDPEIVVFQVGTNHFPRHR
jgi:hypothetical protein